MFSAMVTSMVLYIQGGYVSRQKSQTRTLKLDIGCDTIPLQQDNYNYSENRKFKGGGLQMQNYSENESNRLCTHDKGQQMPGMNACSA